MRRLLLPLARRASDATLFARAVLRRDSAFTVPPRLVPSPASVLVVAPHPDDEAIGCGGTIALAARSRVVFLTGDGGRVDEARRSAQVLGVEEAVFLGLVDGAVDAADPTPLANAIGEARPEAVLVPYPLDRHPDHVAAARLAAAALPDGGPEVWCYEVWSPLDPNRLVDITPVVHLKQEAIACHVTQTSELDYIEAALGLNRYRSLLAPGARYAEAFFACTPRQLARLAERPT